jgi:hypothetical protein
VNEMGVKGKANKRNRLVYGVGINDYPYPVYADGKNIPEYTAWKGMLERCYYPKFQKKYPTYMGCSVADEWKYFSNFIEWLHDNEYQAAYHNLDKDLLIPGNKVYSPDTCLLVTSYINTLLIDCGAARGEFPQGVHFHKATGKYQAQLNRFGKKKYLGRFNSPEAAAVVYNLAKADHLELEAMLCADSRVADALMRHAAMFRGQTQTLFSVV